MLINVGTPLSFFLLFKNFHFLVLLSNVNVLLETKPNVEIESQLPIA